MGAPRTGQRLPLLLAGMAVVLAGCTDFSLRELRKAESKGTPFQTFLAAEYLRFSESEANQYDWIDSKYFADKGLRAIYGNAVEPEAVSGWDVPAATKPALEEARATLMAKLTPDFITSQPEKAARLQFLFDCWLEQQEENWQQEDIASCKQQLFAEMEDAVPVIEEEPQVVSTSYIVFFEWNKDELTTAAQDIINQVVTQIKSEERYEIILNGHTDRSGSESYNLELSQRRVARVREALIAKGASEKAIVVYAFGETDPRLATQDGVREKANRRVEIFINE